MRGILPPARALLLLALAVLAGCGDGGTPPPAPLSVTVSGSPVRGGTVEARVTRDGAAVDAASVEWSFTPAGAAEVTAPGQIRLLQAGAVTLAARAGRSVGTATVTVAEPPPLEIAVTGTLERGAVVTARVTRLGVEVDPATVTWTVSPAGAVTLVSPGQLRLVQSGTITVTARVGESEGSAVLAVAEPPPPSALDITVTGTLERGSVVTARVTRDGAEVDPGTVTWTVSPAGAVTLVSPGQLRLVQSGTITLTAQAAGTSGQIVLAVAEPPPPPLVVTLTGTAERGATVTARVTREGTEVDPATVTWTASPVAAVENLGGGRFRLLQAGAVTLTATAANSTGQSTLTVTEPAALVVQATGRRERGSVLALRVLRDGVEVSPGAVTWTVAPAGTVEVAADGTARLLATGTTTLTAQVEHRSGTLAVAVAAPPTVVFDRVAGGNRDIWRVALDGGELAAVTTHAGDDQDPTVAAGTVVFTSFRGGSADLYAVPLTGGTERLVTGGVGAQTSPALSADGSRVAYTNDAAGVAKIWTVNTAGTGAARATPTSFGFSGSPEAGPAWNPAATQIAFVSAISGAADVYAMAPGGTPVTLIGGPAAEVEPAYSPDGTRVAFVSNRDGDTELYLVTLSTGAVVRLTTRPGSDAQPAWTADGRIVYVAVVDGAARLRWLDPSDPSRVFDIPTGSGAARNPAVVP